MKKVWILEKFASREEMLNSQVRNRAMTEMAKASGNYTEEQIEYLEDFAASYDKVVESNPNGRWYGFEGKANYKQFCDCAKEAIRRNPDGIFRIVEGEIPDNSNMWIGYRFIKENDKVMSAPLIPRGSPSKFF